MGQDQGASETALSLAKREHSERRNSHLSSPQTFELASNHAVDGVLESPRLWRWQGTSSRVSTRVHSTDTRVLVD
jgi:hypothetical protein